MNEEILETMTLEEYIDYEADRYDQFRDMLKESGIPV